MERGFQFVNNDLQLSEQKSDHKRLVAKELDLINLSRIKLPIKIFEKKYVFISKYVNVFIIDALVLPPFLLNLFSTNASNE